MKFIKGVVDRLNVSKYILTHLVGQNHSRTHRKMVGIAVMLFGVGLVKLFMVVDSFFMHVAGDVIGFAIHGVGLIPFVEGVEKIEEVS